MYVGLPGQQIKDKPSFVHVIEIVWIILADLLSQAGNPIGDSSSLNICSISMKSFVNVVGPG